MPARRSTRRKFLKSLAAGSSALAALPAVVRADAAWDASRAHRRGDPPPEIPNDEVRRIYQEFFGDREVRSGHIELDMPAVAEDGRVVPVLIESDLPMTEESYVKAVHLIVDHNPDAHLAAFYLTPALGEVNLSTRIKMKRTTWVRAILETSDGALWGDYARVNVSLNGCG